MAHARPQNRTNNNPWSFIAREDDGSTFVTAVLNLKESHVLALLKCEDPEDPKDEDEAYSLAIVHGRARSGERLQDARWQVAVATALPLLYHVAMEREPRSSVELRIPT